jgi:AbrB family looped-hinge helix DNA binding protein
MAIKSPAVIGRVGRRRQIVIPKQIAEQLHLAVGDFVAVESRPGSIVIRPQKPVDADDLLTPSEDKLLRKADQQMRRGHSVALAALAHELDRTPRRRSRKTA